ncbi:hypothetical protein BDV95DRAFT_606325 [Massariosphaeria phaeospora]|uniref:Rhodopsin domain-containing protein n=1 Tax=Massariosphaeria phaeospora TaxID=100035 RepID=A0A7C8M7H4_9PLEO|nr:hypothetical protein BDV95DRAFT_606325 [Massariosphaeria phaeospora]
MDLFHELSPAAQKSLLEGPAMPPPSGVVSNFSNPAKPYAPGWVIMIMCSILSTVAVVLRMYSKIVCAKRVAIEDYLAIAAIGLYGALQYFVMSFAIYPGYFVHTWDVRLKAVSGIFFKLTFSSTIYRIITMLLKATILLDLRRIFSPRGQRNAFFWTCEILLWTNVLWTIVITFLSVFGCQPRERLWNPLLPEKCMDIDALNVASGTINLAIDLCIFLLPQRVIWRLKLSKRKKFGVSATFAIAIFACIAAAFRLAYAIPFVSNGDVFYNSAYTYLWVQVEATSGFLITGIPALPKIVKNSPALNKFFSRFRNWSGWSVDRIKTESARGLPSWYKPETRRNPRREPGWSDVETTGNQSVAEMIVGSVRHNGHERYKTGACFYDEGAHGISQAHLRGNDDHGGV